MAKSTRPQAGRTATRPARSIGSRQSVAEMPQASGLSGAGLQRSAAVISMPPPAPPSGPAPEALSLFQQAAALIQRHAYDEAARALRSLVERYPAERAILDRARVFLDLCERELKKKPVAPKTVEERITAATAALNEGDDESAEGLVETVLAEVPKHDLALYLMAVVHARRGSSDAAMDALSQAVSVSPDVRAQAKYDADFEILRGMDSFRALTDTTQTPALPRKAKRK
jgi:thioredoxin-like negative regulator of GroEL